MIKNIKEKANKISRIVFSPGFLLATVFFILLFKFQGLFRGGILPGWDTVPHQYALKVMAEDFLPRLKVSGYNLKWFGGFPIFHFYAPLSYIAASAPHFISFKFIPLFLSFRIFVFLSLFFFCSCFYLFCKEFLGKKDALFGIPLSLLFIFCGKQWHETGLGATDAISRGLFSSIFALSLFLLYFALLEKIRRRPSIGNFLLSSLILAALFLTHSISSIAAVFFFSIYIALRRREKIARKALLGMLLALALSAFWTAPFVSTLKYSSGNPVLDCVKNISDYIFMIFPFRLSDIFSDNFDFLAMATFAFFLLGLTGLVRKKKTFLPISLAMAFIFLLGDYLHILLPDLPLHYHRFIPFAFVFSLSVSTHGLRIFFEKIRSNWLKFAVIALLVLGLGKMVFEYDLAVYNPVNFDIARGDIPENIIRFQKSYKYSLSEYPETKNAESVLRYLEKTKPDDRIFVEGAYRHLESIGSPHYFISLLAMEGKGLLNGLLAESSLQSPFIMAAAGNVLSNTIVWNIPSYLREDMRFTSQDPRSMIDRLKLFGMKYAIAYYDRFKKSLKEHKDAQLTKTFGNFHIYEIKNSRPLAYLSPYKPAIFIRGRGGINFREFSAFWFKTPGLSGLPVADGGTTKEALKNGNLDKFHMVFVSGSKLTDGDMDAIEDLEKNHPVIILDYPVHLDSAAYSTWIESDSADQVALDIKRSEILKEIYRHKEGGFIRLVSSGQKVSFSEFSPEKISFSAHGSVIVNAGYFPYWKSLDKEQKVYRITPGQMMVFAKGETVLEYKSGWDKKIGIAVSLAALAATLAILVYAIKTGGVK